MERKTKVHAEAGRPDILITREFDLPVALLFKAYTEPAIVAQWMGTTVLKLDNHAHGGYQFETTDPRGGKHRFNGTIHTIVPNAKITRTFEMEGTAFEVQLEFLEFESLDAQRSRLSIHIVHRSVALRDAVLQLPFAFGINMAHDRLQALFTQPESPQ